VEGGHEESAKRSAYGLHDELVDGVKEWEEEEGVEDPEKKRRRPGSIGRRGGGGRSGGGNRGARKLARAEGLLLLVDGLVGDDGRR
jgi:hypothetical protein